MGGKIIGARSVWRGGVRAAACPEALWLWSSRRWL
jgi:hypothetical protein